MATERPDTPARSATISLRDFEEGLFELDGNVESKNIIVYGDSDAGKTRLAGTLPGKLLILAGGPGFNTAYQSGASATVRLVPDVATWVAGIEWLESGAWQKFDWIVGEDLSIMDFKFRLSYAAEAYDANPTKRQHRNLPDRPDYFNTQNLMRGTITRLVSLPTNCLFTAHAMRTENEDGDLMVYPGIQGKVNEVSNYVSGLMTAVGYLARTRNKEKQEIRRVLWNTTTNPKTGVKYFASDKTGKLKRYMDNPDMPQILAAMDA